jgi:predicted permease
MRAEIPREIRHATRALLRQPAFALTAVLTLGLAIGGTTAIFSVVGGVILRPLPFARPDRLVQIYGSSALVPRADAVNNLGDIRARSSSFSAISAYEVSARYVRGTAGAERIMVVRVEPDFFPALGAGAMLGRTFGRTDSLDAVVISESFWNRRFARESSVVGRTIELDDHVMTVVGVMPDTFQFPYKASSLLSGMAQQGRTDVWMAFDPPLRSASRVGNAIGRLSDGVSVEAANSELRSITAALDLERPAAARGRGAYVVPMIDAVVPTQIRRTLFLLFASVAIVLAIACANVTNLTLVRLTRKSRDIAVRSALGGSALRIAGAFLAESVIIALAGGLLGLAIAWWLLVELLPLAQAWIPRAHEIALDWKTLLFLAGTCALVACIVGLPPLLLARSNLQILLKSSDPHSTMSRTHGRMRDTLVVIQVALAFVLATGGALLIRELVRLHRTDSGMSTHDVVTFHLGKRLSTAGEAMLFYELRERVLHLPRVGAAGMTQLIPLQNWGWTSNSTDFFLAGRPPSAAPPFPIELRYVTPGYFEALGIRMVRGRDFGEADIRDAPAVIVINEALARKQFASVDPVGLQTNRGIVVGVVADVRQVHLDEPAAPEIYFPIAQNWSQVLELGTSLVVRVNGRPMDVIEDVRRVIRDTSPGVAVFNVRTMDDVVSDSLSDFHLYLRLVAGLAGVALLLVGIGVHGVIAFVARARERECAIRVALGASRANVARVIVTPTFLLAIVGIACGLVTATLAAPLLRDLPLTVRPPDIATLACVTFVVAALTAGSCVRPARRIGAVDPALTLREE